MDCPDNNAIAITRYELVAKVVVADMTEGIFSFYRGGIWVTTPTKDINVAELIALVRDGVYKEIVEKLQGLATKEEQRQLKASSPSFDYVTIAGSFSYRNKQLISSASGLCCVDIDDISNPTEIKEKLMANQYINAIFISPSGKGLKVICKIPIEIDKYEGYFLAFAQSLGVDINKIDRSTRDISRACFLSYDPHPFYNPASEVWKTYLEENPTQEWEEIQLKQDKSRSGYEFREIVKLLREGKNVQEIRRIAATQQAMWDTVIAWQKWNQDGTHYQEETLKKATQYILDHPQITQKEVDMGFPTLPLPEAMKLRRPKEWLIKGILPTAGIAYIGGAPKCFKSTLAFHLALCCATGRKFLDHFEIIGKKKVLFIQEENDEDMLDKFGLLGKGMNFCDEEEIKGLSNIHLSLCNGITIDTYGGRSDMAINRLTAKIEELQPDVVFFDSAVRMMEGDENKASDVRRVHNTLKALMKTRRFLGVLLHHTTKKDNVLRGSGDFMAQADVVLMLTTKPTYNGLVFADIPFNRLAPGNFNKFSFRVYSIDDEDKKLVGNEIDVDRIAAMRVGEFDTEETAVDKDDQNVWVWITETNNHRPFTVRDMVGNLGEWGFSKRTLMRILGKLVDEGKIEQKGKKGGWASTYSVPKEIEEELVEDADE